MKGPGLSLQGTFDTFSLPEILELVERAHKTGALEVRGHAQKGVLYFAGGRFSAGETEELYGPVESSEELDARLVDVCFSLFRVETGGFEFEADRFPTWPVHSATAVGPIVEQVEELRLEWPAIEAVIPSLDCCPAVVNDLDGDQIVLDKAAFRVLRVIDGSRSVRQVARELGCGVLEAGRVLKDLVEAGAVTISAEPKRAPRREVVLSERAGGDGLPALPELPEVPGLIVPSSPEALVESIAPAAKPPGRLDESEPGAYRPVDAPPLEAPAGSGIADTPDPGGENDDRTRAEPTPDETAAEAAMPGEGREDASPEGVPHDDGEDPPPDRGALLRLFSALRDT